jgi:putative FmdB family regulatory protein
MPLYEFFCPDCSGVFEHLRSIREAGDPAPCPVCDRECTRVMPTSFAAFSMRSGVPRRLPDRGTYWHLGREVKNRNTGGVPAFQHPETYKPEPRRRPSPADRDGMKEIQHLRAHHGRMLKDSGIRPAVSAGGTPNLSPSVGASGHFSDRDIRRVERAANGKST